jgi:hypothetical protein
VAHFWSLAIEEQFYWMWPLAMTAITAFAVRWRRGRVLGPLVAGYVLFSLSALLTARFLGPDAVYFASWSRFAEILAGAALAALLAGRSVPRKAAALAPLCLAAIVVLAVVTPSATGWAYEGGLPLFALLSAGLITGLQPHSALRSILAVRPVVWIGRVSYELYLFHWPVLLILTRQRTGLADPALSLVRIAVTVAIAALVFYGVELPVRTKRVLARTKPLFTTAGAAIAVVFSLIVLVMPADPASRGPRPTVLAATQLAPAATAAPAAGAGTAAFAPPVKPRARVVAMFGDSVPDWLLRDAAPTYLRTDITVVNGAHEGCDGAVGMPPARDRHGDLMGVRPDCQEWPVSYPSIVEDPSRPIDTAVLMVGQAPYLDRMVGDQWLGPCDNMDWYTNDVSARIGYLRQHVGEVVLALPSWSGDGVTYLVPQDHRARMACIRTNLQSLAVRDQVPVVDLAAELCPAGPAGACEASTSGDGVHVNPGDAPTVLNWVLDSLPSAAGRRTSAT